MVCSAPLITCNVMGSIACVMGRAPSADVTKMQIAEFGNLGDVVRRQQRRRIVLDQDRGPWNAMTRFEPAAIVAGRIENLAVVERSRPGVQERGGDVLIGRLSNRADLERNHVFAS